MAQTPSQQSQTQPPPPPPPAATAADPNPSSDPVQYWCYQCDKRVAVESQADLHEVVCYECKNGFVEIITPAAAAPSSRAASLIDVENPSFGNEFLQVLRMIAQVAREEDAPPPPVAPERPADPAEDGDYLRIELDGWDEVDDDDEDEVNEVEGERDGEDEDDEEHGGEGEGDDRSDEDDEDNEDEEEDENVPVDADELEDILRRRRRAALRLRLRDFATRAASRRNRILDWAEILMGLEDHSIEFRLQVPDMDGYVGNPGDYVDAAGYEALLQNLAESDNGGRRGAPPAAKSAVEALKSFEVKLEEDVMVCAICKDSVNVGEVAKMLPCGHGYHGDCIVPWLGSRNTCPVCRHELPTDDPEYEEDKKKRTGTSVGGGAARGEGGGSSSSGGYIDD